MLKVENETLLWKNRPATVRDLIISEDLLQQIDFNESNEAYSTMVVVNNQLIYLFFPFIQSSKRHMSEHLAKVEEFELRRTMKSLVVPVIDSEVRTLLRQMGEPITLFGEREVRHFMNKFYF